MLSSSLRFRIVGSLVAASAITAAAIAFPQTKPKPHVDRPIVPPRPADVATIEGIVQASYETISGPVGAPRDWGRDRTLFDPNSRSVAIHLDAKTGAIKTESMSEQDFADRSDASIVKDGFTERELKHVIKRYGNVATVLSSYEGSAAGKVIERGVNIFQLYYDGKRWWILSMVWDEESPDNPIPPELR